MIGTGFGRCATYRLNREYVASSDVASSPDSIVNSTVESTFGSKNHIEGQVNDDLGQEEGQENRNEGQVNKDLGQVNSEQGQVNEIFGLTDMPYRK